MDFMIKPVVTEKATKISGKGNRYTFRVSPKANKFQIKSLIEQLYDVKVLQVNTMNFSGKKKSRYTRAGVIAGKVAAFKKALFTVSDGQTIDFYSNI